MPYYPKESRKNEAKGQERERAQKSNDRRLKWQWFKRYDDEEEQVENLCFMVNEDLIQEEETEYESSDKVDYSEFLEYSKRELAQALIKAFDVSKNICLK